MKTKHTQGEWKYQGGDNYSVEINIGETTAVISRDDKNTGVLVISREEMEANAKLIAAAPELLEALEYAKRRIVLLEQYTEGKCDASDMRKINNAIQKATE